MAISFRRYVAVTSGRSRTRTVTANGGGATPVPPGNAVTANTEAVTNNGETVTNT